MRRRFRRGDVDALLAAGRQALRDRARDVAAGYASEPVEAAATAWLGPRLASAGDDLVSLVLAKPVLVALTRRRAIVVRTKRFTLGDIEPVGLLRDDAPSALRLVRRKEPGLIVHRISLWIRARDGRFCLNFAPVWREEADAIAAALPRG